MAFMIKDIKPEAAIALQKVVEKYIDDVRFFGTVDINGNHIKDKNYDMQVDTEETYDGKIIFRFIVSKK